MSSTTDKPPSIDDVEAQLDAMARSAGFDPAIVPPGRAERRALVVELGRIARMAPDQALERSHVHRRAALEGGTDRLLHSAISMFARQIADPASAQSHVEVGPVAGGQPLDTTGQAAVIHGGRPGPGPAAVVGHSTRALAYRAVADVEQARGADEHTRIDAVDRALRKLNHQIQSPARSYSAEQRAEDEDQVKALESEREQLEQRLTRKGSPFIPRRQWR